MSNCKTCGALIRRKRVNTRLENERTFLSREFCDVECTQKYFFKEIATNEPCAICGSKRKMQNGNEFCDPCLLRANYNQLLTKEVSHDKTKIKKIGKLVLFRKRVNNNAE